MARALTSILFLFLCGCAEPDAEITPDPLPDGVYEVLAVEAEASALEADGPGTRVLPFDHAFLRGGEEEPVEFVLLRTEGAAPLDLAEAPTSSTMGDRPVLLLRLDEPAGAALKALTARARRAAVVVNGAIVTVHRIRVPIEGGRLQVSC